MYADISDYAELKFKTASTGLIFSSSSMAQKFGGAFGGAAVMWLLAAFGFNTEEGAVQTEVAIIYPLTTKRMKEIGEELKKFRK